MTQLIFRDNVIVKFPNPSTPTTYDKKPILLGVPNKPSKIKIELSKFEKFLEKHKKKIEINWHGFLTWKGLEFLVKNTQIRKLTLNHKSYQLFIEKYYKKLRNFYNENLLIFESDNFRPHSINYPEIRTSLSLIISIKNIRLEIISITRHKRPRNINPTKFCEFYNKHKEEFTQMDLAKFFKVSQSTISRYIKDLVMIEK